MKVALVTDTHFGARGDSYAFLDYFEAFFDDVFWPTLEERGIKTVWHLGDLVDRRKFGNYYTLRRMRLAFLSHFGHNSGLDCKIICGNHDVYHKNTNQVNALHELINGYNIEVLIDPAERDGFLFLPWINPTNYDESIALINDTKADYVFGHLELSGFEMDSGKVADHGFNPGLFSRFKGVYSGHYHHKSNRGNIHYLGSPYQITWGDYADPRGFHIFDTGTGELEFIQNPYNMFHVRLYDDVNDDMETILGGDFFQYNKRYLKVIIKNKTNPVLFDKFIEEIEKVQPYNLQVIEETLSLGALDNPEIQAAGQDTLTIIRAVVDELPDTIDKEGVGGLMTDLFEEAMQENL